MLMLVLAVNIGAIREDPARSGFSKYRKRDSPKLELRSQHADDVV